MGRLENIYEGDWSTVSLTATALGLTVRERFERFKVEAMSELVLRLAGGLMVAGSTLLWLVLPLEASADQIVSHSLLATLFTATGLVVYAYGTRGFRRQLSLDAKRGTLALTKINMNDQGRVVRSIRLNEIESLFLRRPAGRTGFASLYVRVAGQDSPLLALTGATPLLIHALGATLLVGRVIHAAGLLFQKGPSLGRILGMALTYAVLLFAAGLLIGQAIG